MRDPTQAAGEIAQLRAALAAAEAERDRLQQRLDDCLRTEEQIAAGAAHDLRAPLRAIDGFAGAALRAQPEAAAGDEARGYLERIREAARRMGGLVESLLTLSSAARVELQPAAVDLGFLAEWALAELQDAEPERACELEVAPELAAWGDERELRQLLRELLANAWRFTPPERPVRIAVQGSTQDGRTLLTIRDGGRGLDLQYRETAFGPFQRLHGREEGAGHGLGLAIARSIARRHGGEVRIADSSPDGTTVELELPASAETFAAG